jgi:hypothetical protein
MADLQTLLSKWLQALYAGTSSWANNALGTTSTDGLVIANETAATSGTTVQISPRIRLAGTAWNTAASKTVSFFEEVLPATAATPTGTWKIGYILEGVAATYPMTLTSGGALTTASGISSGNHVGAAGSGFLYFAGQTYMTSPADGQMIIRNAGNTAGVGLDVTTDATLKIRTRAQTGYATVDALAYQVSAEAGIDATVTTADLVGKTITFKKGIITGYA